MPFDPVYLKKITYLVHERIGIRLGPEKRYLLESRLEKLLRRENFGSIEEFCRSLEDGNNATFEILIRYMTTNHTYFFREEEQFHFLTETIAKRNMKAPVIWSAACSTGEEPYSITIAMLERKISDFLVVASDINATVLKQTARGVYHQARLEFTRPPLIEKYFRRVDEEHWRVHAALRRFLRIKKINLVEPVDFEIPFDFIFCRNLLIYFDQQVASIVLKNLLSNLKVSGVLFVGNTEVLLTPPPNLKKIKNSIYQKVAAS